MKKILTLIILFSSLLQAQPDQWYKNGIQAYNQGNTLRAKSLLKKVIENQPDNSMAFYYLGMSYLIEQEFAKSIEYLSESIRLNTQFPEAFNSRGIAYSYEGDLDFAISDFDRAILLDPEFTQAYINRGSAFVSTGQSNFAMEDFDSALKLDPKNPAVLYQRGKLYSDQKNFQLAIVDYENAIYNGLNNAQVHYEMGNTYFQLNQFNKAVASYTKSIDIDPQHHKAINNRAVSYEKLGQKNKADADRKLLAKLAGYEFVPLEQIEFDTFSSSDNWISVQLPNGWFKTEIAKDDNQVEIIITPKQWYPGMTEPMAMVTISVQKNMNTRYQISDPNALIEFWSASNAKNSQTYESYSVIRQKIKDFKEVFKSKTYETKMQIEKNAVVYHNIEFVAAKESYLMYSYFQAPENQFEYYRPIFENAIQSLELK